MTMMLPSGKKKKKKIKSEKEGEEPAEDPELKKKKKQFPGLCIPDNTEHAQKLIIPEEDKMVASDAMNEVCTKAH